MNYAVILAATAMLAACASSSRIPEEAAAVAAPARAVIATSAGEIVVELSGAAPISTANFVAHAAAGTYDGGAFYRSVRPDNDRPDVAPMSLIQGGQGFDGLGEDDQIAHESTAETGLTHARGAISMGRFDPGTATSEFFIMVEDYPGLDAGPDTRNPDGQGYAVFGEVVDGMDVVEAIWGAPTSSDQAPQDFPYAQFLVEPVRIETVRVED